MLLYKYRSLDNFKNFVDILLYKRLYAALYHDLNDPMEGVYDHSNRIPNRFIKELNSNKKKIRIVSLSRKNNIQLMWAHYANGHKGVAFGVEIDKSKYDLRPIDYLPELFYLDNGWMPSLGGNACDILSKKLDRWKYEEEERVFIKDETQFVDVRIVEVITGSKMSTQDYDMLKKLIETIDENIIIKKED